MTTLNLEYAQDHLAELVEKAGNGESFVITKGGTPIAQLTAIDAPAAHAAGSQPEKPLILKRTGFMRGQIRIPDDFDTMGSAEIERLFESGE